MASFIQNLVRGVAAIAGGVIGYVGSGGNPAVAFQGATLGYSIGSLVTPSTVQGPRLEDLSVQNSSYGLPIPIIYGGYRFGGNVIWSIPIVEKVKKKKKKLFNKITIAKTKIYSYHASFAVGLCEGEIQGIRRIWADGKLVYDARDVTSTDVEDQVYIAGTGIPVTVRSVRLSASAEFQKYFTLYTGTETQLQDPTILAADGAENTPAYRGLAYIVFKELPLLAYNNRRPSVEFETSAVLTPETSNQSQTAVLSWPRLNTGDPGYPAAVSFHPTSYTIGPFQYDATIRTGDASGASGFTGVDDFLFFNGVKYVPPAGNSGNIAPGYLIAMLPAGDTIFAQVQNSINGKCEGTLTYTAFYESLDFYSASSASAQLDEIVSDLCERSGLTPAQYDVSDLTGIVVNGYAVARTTSVREAISPLSAYAGFDGVESDGLLRFKRRGGPAVRTLTYDDVAAHASGSERPSARESGRMQEAELPRSLSISYASLEADYQVSEQIWQRVVTRATAKANIQLPIVMGNDTARLLAERSLYTLWAERTPIKLSLAPRHFDLDAGDVVMLSLDGDTIRLRITSQDYALSGPVSVECISEDASYYNGSITLDGGGTLALSTPPGAVPGVTDDSVVNNSPGETVLTVLDIPLLATGDDGAGFYAALTGTTGGWPGATLFISTDGGATYDPSSESILSANIGFLTAALPSGPSTVIDAGNSLIVRLATGRTLSSINAASFDQLENLAAVGLNGRWELLQFQTATVQMDGTWLLTGLTRGRFGTERVIGTSMASDYFVLLDGAVEQVPYDLQFRDVEIQLKAVTEGTEVADATAQAFTWTAQQLLPLSPANASVQRASDGAITLTWQRRSRYGTELPDGNDIALGEASESYEVDVMSGATVVRTITAITPAASYSAAQQTTDFGSAQSSITFRIYQISASVGRGTKLEKTL